MKSGALLQRTLTSFAVNEGGRLNARYRLLCHASSIDPVKMKHLKIVVLLRIAVPHCTVPDGNTQFAGKIDIDFASRSVAICIVSPPISVTKEHIRTYIPTAQLSSLCKISRTVLAHLERVFKASWLTCM